MSGFEISPQIAYVYDTDRGVALVFDGVVKVDTTSSVKMEEDSDNHKGYDYINNALNQPDEVTLDIIQSNVYTTKNALSGSGANRAANSYQYLKDLKTDRRRVQVITNLCTYDNMILQSVSTIQDDSTGGGWSGSLAFREYLSITKDGGSGSSGSSNGSVSSGSSRQRSIWVDWVGPNFM